MKLILLLSLCLTLISCSSQTKIQSAAELEDFPYPFPTKKFFFSSQNQKLQMTYADLGTKEAKKTVVLLHGKNFSGFYWKAIADELVKMNYRVVIPDQIGFGKSSKPAYYQFSFGQLALNTEKLLDHIGVDRYLLVGHSMGGMLATHLAYANNRVEKLILINPIGLEDYSLYSENKDPEFFYKNELNKSVEAFRQYQVKNYYDGKWNESYEALLAPFKYWKESPAFSRVAWNNALTYSPIFNESIVSKLSSIKKPTVLILGTRDRTGPGRGWKKEGITHKFGQYQLLGKQIKKRNKRIKLIELEGLGHMPQFEDVERFNKVFYKHL
jgi:pimeloyl-ACP methyl ester carboxylesterase